MTANKAKVITLAILVLLFGITIAFISVASQPTSAGTIPTAQCAIYKTTDKDANVCATCGNGVCERFEQCTPTDDNPNGCGTLYCPQDCQN